MDWPASSDSRHAIGRRLEALRIIRAPSQAAFCAIAGISTQAWNNYETGRRRIDLDQAMKLCQRFGVTLDWIYRGNSAGLPHQLALELGEAERRLAS